MRQHIFICLCFYIHGAWAFAPSDTLSLVSPSGKISLRIWKEQQLQYKVYNNNQLIVGASAIDFQPINHPSLATVPLDNHKRRSNNTVIISPVPEKRRRIPDVYNELVLSFKPSYHVTFRAYDDGVAYQISTQFKDSIYIENEIAQFALPEQSSGYLPIIHKKENADVFHTSFEEPYPLVPLTEVADSMLAYLPVLLMTPLSSTKIAIAESDLRDYPGMFLQGTGSNSLKAVFAGYPLQETMTNDLYAQAIVTKRADYIARTAGTRSYPWRILMIAHEDKDLPANDLVYRLASPSSFKDTSWIHPGKCTDEWIVDINLFNVPFRAGLNTDSYKYYIDFAKRFGFDRIMMDAGWSDNLDLFKVNPDINMDTLTAYAKWQGIKISMWTLASTLDRQLDRALAQFNKWDVDFIMTDFMDRDDQKMIQFYERTAQACADHHIMIMYHGAYPPKGFNRTYPNAITREGVMGSEYNIWSDKVTPPHDLILPFTRMLAGSMDYEPGLLNNATKSAFRPVSGEVMSAGTRCHQLAMFVVYDSPMQIFSGNPSQGYLEPRFMDFLGSIPAGWDDTKVLDAQVGEFIVTARKKEDQWFVGSMTNWSPRTAIILFDFLDEGVYHATICKDGINADRHAADYVFEELPVKKGDQVTIDLAPGGGFVIRLQKEKP